MDDRGYRWAQEQRDRFAPDVEPPQCGVCRRCGERFPLSQQDVLPGEEEELEELCNDCARQRRGELAVLQDEAGFYRAWFDSLYEDEQTDLLRGAYQERKRLYRLLGNRLGLRCLEQLELEFSPE